MPRLRLLNVLAAAILGFGPAVTNAQTAYTSRQGFLDALLTKASNNLEAPVVGDDPQSQVSGLVFTGVTNATLLNPSGVGFDAGLTLAAIGAGQAWVVNSAVVTSISFNGPVNGFGAQFFGYGSVGPMQFRLYPVGGLPATVVFPTATLDLGDSGFFGVTLATPFDRLDVEALSQEFYEMDDLAAGVGLSAVPEPSALALLGAGSLVLLVGAGRRGAPGHASQRAEATHA